MLCLGPVCVPVWQAGVILVALLGPLKAVAAYIYETCSRRRKWVSENEEFLSSKLLLLHRGAGGCPAYEEVKRRLTQKEVHVHHIRSDEEMKSFWENLQRTEDTKVFADFSAQWCGPCRTIAPFYELLCGGYEGVFISIDIDECPQTAEAAGVNVLPTLGLLKNTAPGAANSWEVVAQVQIIISFYMPVCAPLNLGTCEELDVNRCTFSSQTSGASQRKWEEFVAGYTAPRSSSSGSSKS